MQQQPKDSKLSNNKYQHTTNTKWNKFWRIKTKEITKLQEKEIKNKNMSSKRNDIIIKQINKQKQELYI